MFRSGETPWTTCAVTLLDYFGGSTVAIKNIESVCLSCRHIHASAGYSNYGEWQGELRGLRPGHDLTDAFLVQDGVIRP